MRYSMKNQIITYSVVKNFFVKNVNKQINPLSNKLCFKFVIKTFRKESNFIL